MEDYENDLKQISAPFMKLHEQSMRIEIPNDMINSNFNTP